MHLLSISLQNDACDSTEQIQDGQVGKVLSVKSGTSSNQGSATAKHHVTIEVILHAFINPDHWGRTCENLTIEVRSDLDWTKNCAEIHFGR